MVDPETLHNVRGYLARAWQMIDTGRLTLKHQDYITAVNRAYYAVFYAANALLATQHLERSNHSGVIAAFREHFQNWPDRSRVQRLVWCDAGHATARRLYARPGAR